MYIDLTLPLTQNTLVYPGDPPIKVKPAGTMSKDGFNDHYLSLGTHAGTHIDAPYHMLAEGQKLGLIPVDRFFGRGRYIKLLDKKFDILKLKDAEIETGDIVIFHTGMDAVYPGQAYLSDYPPIPKEIAEYLVNKKVSMVGVDMCSVDQEEFTAHKILLAGNVLIIENLTNLEQLAGKDFRVYALPINLQLDGAPARVVADIKS